ncbi:MAG: Asp23/Gls24 family envelope stress response protein [Lachnospiraceae bacterium]|nr:Asp23/Gls24 family envelope stress response protein [Lachnospiraceae bacterium]
MKGQVNTQLGRIVVDNEAIAQYAGTEAMECFGIVGMAGFSMKDGLVKLLRRDSLTRGVNVSVADNRISIDFHVIVAYGVSIKTVAANLMDSVKYKLESFTGFEVERINVFVEGVRVID